MKKRVLVVEDDYGIRMAVAALLEDEGYDVVLAADGMDGLEKYAAATPSLVVLDMMMPVMDGFAFAEELQRRGTRGSCPILVLTADSKARQKAQKVSAEGYLAKPFDIVELLQEVARLVGD